MEKKLWHELDLKTHDLIASQGEKQRNGKQKNKTTIHSQH